MTNRNLSEFTSQCRIAATTNFLLLPARSAQRVPQASEFHGLRLRTKVLKSVFPFYVFPFVRYKILLSLPGLVLVLYSMLFPYLLLFLGEKTMFSFQTLLKGTFSHLTCHLFSITVRVSMTLKRQWVQSLSDHKTGRTFCVSQERWIVEGMVWSKTNGRSVLSGATKGGGGGRGRRLWWRGGSEWDWGEKRKIRLKLR